MLSVFGAIGSLSAGAFDQLGVFLLLPCSVCAVWVGVRVGVAVGAGAPVDVAVGGHVDVTAFLQAELILARALMFLFVLVAWSCCGMDCAVACVRNSRMLMAFIKNANRVIAKRRQDCTHIGKSQTVCKFEFYFRGPQPLQRWESMLAAIGFF